MVRLNTADLIQPWQSVHKVPISNLFNAEVFDLLMNVFRYLHIPPKSEEFDPDFTTILDRPINTQYLLHDIRHSRSIKSYVIDSLKRYHSLADVMSTLSSCLNGTENNHDTKSFLDIIEHITKYALVVGTIESLSLESQRFLGNMIRKNGLPIPLAYYTCNKDALEFKINFNPLAETFCFSNEHVLLCIGSPTAVGLGKTSVLPYLFENIRSDLLNTEGVGELRLGCIDTLFASFTNNAPYVVFDVHGTMTTMNEDLVTAIQHHCDVQLIFVTETDLENKDFLLKTMNYSNETRKKPTMIIVFDSKYGERNNTFSLDQFQQAFTNEGWSHSHWITAPIFGGMNRTSQSNEERRLQRLRQTLLESFTSLSTSIHSNTNYRSIFTIQSYFLTIKSSGNAPLPTYTFEIEEKLKLLFDLLSDATDNLKIVTPISYFESEKLRCEKQLSELWEESSVDLQQQLEEIQKQFQSIDRIPEHTMFFINLLTHHSYIDLLIMEWYLERWRAKYELPLSNRLREAKNNGMIWMSRIKQLEEQCQQYTESGNQDKIENTLNEIQLVKEQYKVHQNHIIQIGNQLSNIDLTIGLFCDEIFALYEHSSKLFEPNNLTELLTKKFAELMCKGFSFHILRGRPLRCSSKLIQASLKHIHPSTNKTPLVLTVIGEQSSAKSSLMNATFGCNFRVSAGRCTLGIYLSVARWRDQTIVILDTEGLLSLEESGSIFDNQMVSLAMLSSHLVLINHKGEFSSNLEHLIGMSFYAKLQIRSPLKPKLLFVLRDQADINATRIFFGQLLKLKENLYNDSKFLKSSIDDEIEMNNQDVILLPNAFSSDYNSILQVEQTWRNRTFPMKINDLREMIIRSLAGAKTQIYHDVPELFQKIVNNWDAIDKLGANLFACKTLYELSVMNELRDIARDIIEDCITAVNNDGQRNIDMVLSTISSENYHDLEHDHLTKRFHMAMQLTHEKIVQKAFADYYSKTERSCFLPEIKEKVKKLIEPSISNMQGLLREEFGDRLYKARRDARISNVHRHLIEAVQQEFDRSMNLDPEQLHRRIEEVYKSELGVCLQVLQREFNAKTEITGRVIKFFNSDWRTRATNAAEGSVYNLLSAFDTPHFQHACERLNDLHERVMQQNECHQQPTTSWFGRLKAYFRFYGSKHHLELLWNKFYQPVECWFRDTHYDDKNKKLLLKIIESLLPQMRNDIKNLVNTQFASYSADPRLIRHVFTFIENLYHDQLIQQHRKDLQPHKFLFDIAVLALNILIEDIVQLEQHRHTKEVEKAQKDMMVWKENIKLQINHMRDSFEQGKDMAKIVGEEILKDIGRILLDKILHDVTEDIAKSHFINHDTVQKQAYEESFGQGNGEKILKFVLDINRYFCELSLREIRTKLEAIILMHTRDAEQILTKMFNVAHDIAQRSQQANVRFIVDEIEKGIFDSDILAMSVHNRFALDAILSVPIQDLSNFKKGFKTIRDHIGNIQDHVANLTRSVKAKAYSECKKRISRRLGCQSRCPGCGSKCSLPEPHDEELVEQWHECQCEPGKCKCARPQPILHGVHKASHHLAEAFFGRRYYKLHTPVLKLCYQHWMTSGMYLSDDELESPLKKYYNQYHPEWYNNLQERSTAGNACDDGHPPPEQRRAWMIVRRVLLARYASHGMVEQENYDEKRYPVKIEVLSADFNIKWNDTENELVENDEKYKK